MDINIDIKIKIDDNTEIKVNYEEGLKIYNELKKIYGQRLNGIASNEMNSNVDISNRIYGPIIKKEQPLWTSTLTLPTSFISTTNNKEDKEC